ncbi:MAG: family 20 glycosylhydrolase [Bacteroidales bacterium]|nr:family 20 glycosylhydrolase [Bacteroidales bacterium]
MKRCILSLVSLIFALHVSAQGPEVLIPAPAEVTVTGGSYKFSKKGPKVKVQRLPEGEMPAEAYRIIITKRGITISTSDWGTEACPGAGLSYALQTLDQMTAEGTVHELQCCEIYDYSRFPYRGLHVDVSRHFRSVDFLKKQIDAMAMFKMNRMHIHLTDAAGWRLQIDAYPRLTQFAAWRSQHTWKEWWAGDRHYAEEGDPGAYGGYYTKEEIRDLVSYARARHIEIIPEIEMPSHSEEVLAAYPELGCSGEAYQDSDFCVGNEEVFNFLETVLDEVMEVFPSEYIHIGGDEAGKQHWKTCPKCQKRMQEEGLKDVDELQSYMIKRMARYVESKGRKVIGWDEILDGGLAEGAAVMSWRGTEGGIAAMNMGHDVVMSPGRYCYLDHTQDAPFKEPQSIGGYLPLDSVYVYEPLEPSMPADKVHHLKGVQANLWSEYIVTDEHAEYMYWPRAIALAETGWSLPGNKDVKNFRQRVLRMLEIMRAKGYQTFDLENEYGERDGFLTGVDHKAKGCKVIYNKPIQDWYQAAGEKTFTDGVIGGWTYSDNRWQGFLSDIDVTIDMGSVQPVSYVGGTFMQLIGPGVFMPRKVDILVSEDGEDFTYVATIENDVPTSAEELTFRTFETSCDLNARYIRYHAYRSTMRGFLFLDEVVVN